MKRSSPFTMYFHMTRLWGYLTAAFQYLKGIDRKDWEGLFIRGCTDRTRNNSFKLKEDRLQLGRLFTIRMVRHWNRLPHLEVLYGALSNWIWLDVPLPRAGRLELDDP